MTFGSNTMAQKIVRYLPLGDSYTIGENVSEEERFPNQLKQALGPKIDLQILANPAVTGWTTQDLIDKQLPIFAELKPDFVSLLIGVNDWVQQVPAEKFESNLAFIINTLLLQLKDKKKLVVIDIPDFSASPEGAKYGHGRNITEGIRDFDAIIERACKRHKLTLVSIFKESQEMRNDSTLIAGDGLHPSGKEYKVWVEKIAPKVLKNLK